MPRLYRLSNPGVSSISHDRRIHEVNADGLLVVQDNDFSPGLHNELLTNFGAQEHIPDRDGRALPPAQLMNEDEIDRAVLFTKLDTIFGRKIDRRKSLPQLKEMLADHEARQARTVGASKTVVTGGTQGSGDSPAP